MNHEKKWKVTFFRDTGKTDHYISCGPYADAAMDYCKGYFHLGESKLPITLSAVEVSANEKS